MTAPSADRTAIGIYALGLKSISRAKYFRPRRTRNDEGLLRRRAILTQDFAGEIERAGDQNPRRRIEVELARGLERLSEIVAAGGGQADGTRGVSHRFRAQAFVRVRHRHGDQPADEPGEIAQEAFAILARQHADNQNQRTRDALFEIGERRRNGAAAVGIMAAVEPQLAPRGRKLDQTALAEPVQPRRPFGLDDAGFERGRRNLEWLDRAQRRDGEAGILELMAAVKFRRRQIEQARFILIDQASALLGGGPILAGNLQRRAEFRRLPFDHGERVAALRGDDRRHAALEDAGLLGRDLVERVPEKVGVVDRNARDDRGQWLVHHIVASNRPPSPTSNSSTSAGWRANNS